MIAPSLEEGVRPARPSAADAALLVALKLAIGAWVLFQGFTHVSDDDYARTVIAQQFAHGPRLDPSGTSWLPLPFWLVGGAMGLAGRSLATARAIAVVLGAASVVAPFVAMRAIGVRRVPALVATVVAMALPWNAWLGVAMVPEAWSAALLAAAIIAMDNESARPWAAAGLLVASLSRYEAWPACALFALRCGARAWGVRAEGARGRAIAGRELAWAAVAMVGPLLWMGWNAYAHGSATHFLTRVSTFRRAIGAADRPLTAKVLGYPRALVTATPEVATLGFVGLIGLAARPTLRRRWAPAALGLLAIALFLIVGDVRDGAPTHHPERALAALWWVGTGMGIDAIASAWARLSFPRVTARAAAATALALAVVAWAFSLPPRWHDAPGLGESEGRASAIAHGHDMAARHVAAAEITPCAFEHFALLAAWGQPERARLNPPSHEPPTAACPHVVELPAP